MKKSLCVVFLVFVTVLMNLEILNAAGEFEQISQQLVAKLHKYFPQIRGTIVSVQDDTVFIDIGIEQEISAGAQFALLEEGIEITHPTTNEVLGTYEKQIGVLQVIDVREQFSVARILWQEPEVRITQGTTIGGFPGKMKVALLSVENHTDTDVRKLAAYTSFVQALHADARFTVFEEADIRTAALKAGLSADIIPDKDVLAQLEAVLHPHNFLQLSFQSLTDTLLATITLFSSNGEKIGSVQEIMPESAVLQLSTEVLSHQFSQATAAVDTQQLALTQDPEQPPLKQKKQDRFWTSDFLRMKAHKIAVGDLIGDGENEMVVSTPTDLEIYEHGAMGEKDGFFQVGKIEGYNDALILALGIGDINQNGRAEIFITTLRTVSAEVRVFEYRDGKFREIWETKGIAMRIIHTPAGKTLLVGQKTTSSISMNFLTGKLSVYMWDGNDYTRKERLNVPGRVDIFGFSLADVNKDGREEVLFYDRFDRIDMFRGAARQWRSRGAYEPYKMYLVRKGEDEKKGRQIPGRIELTRLGTDRDLRLILFKNLRQFKFIKGLPLYNGSRLYIFRWNGETFVLEFTSEEFESYIVDYAVADVDNDGKQEVALATVLKGDNFFKTPQSQIMVYELEK